MDFNERMKQMRQELENKRRELEDKLTQNREKIYSDYWNKAESENSVNTTTDLTKTAAQNNEHSKANDLPELIHHKDLEDDSETKLGMFETLYNSTYLNCDSRTLASFGYSDIDFSPLTNLLCGIAEIELYASLSLLAQKNGISLPERNRCSLGDLLEVLHSQRCMVVISRYISEPNKLIKQIREIKSIRNSSNHKGVVNQPLFINFFKKIYEPFFNQSLPGLLNLKNRGKRIFNDEQYSRTTSYNETISHRPLNKEDSNFLSTLEEIFSANQYIEVKESEVCVIWTNTEALALKYLNEVVSSENINYSKIIYSFIKRFINDAASTGIKYIILDSADPEYNRFLDQEKSWESHLNMLDAFRLKNLDHLKSPVGLFIIGGDDVIPMPRLRNPLHDKAKDLKKLDLLEASIEVDWLYCFEAQYINVDKDGYLNIDKLSNVSPVFHVGRLPMENGLMETLPENDLDQYFSKSLSALKNKIDIDKMGIVVSENCKFVGSKVVNGFPLPDLSTFDSCYQHQGKFVSPKIDLTDKDNPDKKAVIDKYRNTLKQCNMLHFDLHGGPSPNVSAYAGASYYGEKVPAFEPYFLKDSKVKIIVPICCWGAKFIGYNRNNSTLLYSMYDSSTLIFMGSCRSAYGPIDNPFINHNKELISEPQTLYAERLLRLFMQYILTGYTAGQSLSMAKTEYLSKYSNNNVYDFLTVQQFNLFGDPMLRSKPILSKDDIVIDEESSITISLPDFKTCDYSYNETCIYSKNTKDSISILDRVRQTVDKNLCDIRDRMNELLYKYYNIDPENLKYITQYKTGKGLEGMRFVYSERGDYPSEVSAITDAEGNPINIIHSF